MAGTDNSAETPGRNSDATASPSQAALGKPVPWWVKALVAFHAFAILMWALPSPPSRPWGSDVLLMYDQRLKDSFLRYYLTTTGFWQYWDMFSPNPADTDIWCDTIVTFKDGTKKLYKYPRMKELSIPVKYFKERYRKFYERVNQDKNKYLWPTFAQRIALENYRDPNNPPVEVRLRRHFRVIPPPGKPVPKDYTVYEYYVHVVDQRKLRSQARL